MSFTVCMCTFNIFMFKSVQGSKKSLYLTYVPENIHCGLFEESQFLPCYVGMWSTVCSFYTKCPVHTTTIIDMSRIVNMHYSCDANHPHSSGSSCLYMATIYGQLCLMQ